MDPRKHENWTYFGSHNDFPTIQIWCGSSYSIRERRQFSVLGQNFFWNLTMKVLQDTPAVLSPGKLGDEHGYSYEWINGQVPHLIWNGIRLQCSRKISYQSWFLVYQRVLPQAWPLQHPDTYKSRKLIIPNFPEARLP